MNKKVYSDIYGHPRVIQESLGLVGRGLLSSFFLLHNGAMVLVTCLRHTTGVCGVPHMAELSAAQRH